MNDPLQLGLISGLGITSFGGMAFFFCKTYSGGNTNHRSSSYVNNKDYDLVKDYVYLLTMCGMTAYDCQSLLEQNKDQLTDEHIECILTEFIGELIKCDRLHHQIGNQMMEYVLNNDTKYYGYFTTNYVIDLIFMYMGDTDFDSFDKKMKVLQIWATRVHKTYSAGLVPTNNTMQFIDHDGAWDGEQDCTVLSCSHEGEIDDRAKSLDEIV